MHTRLKTIRAFSNTNSIIFTQTSSSSHDCLSLHFFLVVLFFLFLFSHVLLVSNGEQILFGGSFTLSASSKQQQEIHLFENTIQNLALYNTETSSVTPFYKTPPDGPIHVVLYESKCDMLFVGGRFTSIDGVKTGPIAVKIAASSGNSTSNLWTSLNVFDRDIYMGEWSANATVLDIKVFYNNVFKQCQPSILMAGQFTKAAGIDNVNNVVMIDTNSLKWDLFASAGVRGVRGTCVNTVLIHDDNYIFMWVGIFQNNHVYEDVFVIGGAFTAPKQYLFLYKPSKSIHYIRHFKKRVILLSPFQVFDDDSTMFGIRKMDIYQDQLYMAGEFVYQSDWGEIMNFLSPNINGYVSSEQWNTSQRLFTNTTIHTLSLCKPPFKFCSKGSYVIAKRDFEISPNHNNHSDDHVYYYKDFLSLVLYKENDNKNSMDSSITIDLFVEASSSEMDTQVIHSAIFLANSCSTTTTIPTAAFSLLSLVLVHVVFVI
ncbi:hypothetical protein FDP41_001034 [Naegleria fowleri]|uniref:Uncharacterized protein n=1 Tax=Naegleria fowleri TaxID=5763 RepID=A0A6A5BZA0_NAEFO|nr:uncharacterized protein FDP41_001034 [Naegleria fowleri]KAF0979881.1 hypothetical protein FDP41_001034 [Naegleria fowleri]